MAWIVGPTSDELQLIAEAGVIHRDSGRFAEARDIFKGLCELCPTDAVPYVELGKTYLQEGDFDAAGRQYATALLIDPSSGYVHAAIAEEAFFRRDPVKMKMHGAQAMELDRGGKSGDFACRLLAEVERLGLL
jgi:tetratricopeptide (TPR) repeat protein